MANIKFEECLLKSNNNFISVEDLKKIYDRHDESYESDYYNNFYCPECFVAQLSFHPNAQTPHFRSKGIHEEECSFNFLSINKKQMDEYCNNKQNRDEINRKLNSCLDLLNMCNKQLTMRKANTFNKKEKENLVHFTVEHKGIRRSIRRKKLTIEFTEADYNLPMIFYGTVSLEWDLRDEKVKFLRIRDVNEKKYICSMTISNNIYSYIENNMKFDGKEICDVAFISSMKKKDNFNNCRIKYSTELIIRSSSKKITDL